MTRLRSRLIAVDGGGAPSKRPQGMVRRRRGGTEAA
jgi:hypothetical protein